MPTVLMLDRGTGTNKLSTRWSVTIIVIEGSTSSNLDTAIVIRLQARFFVESIFEANSIVGHIRLLGSLHKVQATRRDNKMRRLLRIVVTAIGGSRILRGRSYLKGFVRIHIKILECFS